MARDQQNDRASKLPVFNKRASHQSVMTLSACISLGAKRESLHPGVPVPKALKETNKQTNKASIIHSTNGFIHTESLICFRDKLEFQQKAELDVRVNTFPSALKRWKLCHGKDRLL